MRPGLALMLIAYTVPHTTKYKPLGRLEEPLTICLLVLEHSSLPTHEPFDFTHLSVR